MTEEAYPALFVVPRGGGVETPTEDDVLQTVNDALEDVNYTPHDTVLDVRRGARDLQDEIPPAAPIEVEGVTVVFDQVQAPEASDYYDGPFEVAKMALGREFDDCEVWIDAVIR